MLIRLIFENRKKKFDFNQVTFYLASKPKRGSICFSTSSSFAQITLRFVFSDWVLHTFLSIKQKKLTGGSSFFFFKKKITHPFLKKNNRKVKYISFFKRKKKRQ
jgi:hypothetical protein